MQKTAEEKKLYEWVKVEGKSDLPELDGIYSVRYKTGELSDQQFVKGNEDAKVFWLRNVVEWLKEYKSQSSTLMDKELNLVHKCLTELYNIDAAVPVIKKYLKKIEKLSLQSIKGEDKPVEQQKKYIVTERKIRKILADFCRDTELNKIDYKGVMIEGLIIDWMNKNEITASLNQEDKTT